MTVFPSGRRTFFLDLIEEPDTNVLRIVIAEATTQGPEVQVPQSTIKARLVSRIPGEQPWELMWDDYIAYAVRNESYWQSDNRPHNEDRLIIRTRSAFLDFIKASTFASSDYPGEFSHWELICADHVIDVVSMQPPEIRRLGK